MSIANLYGKAPNGPLYNNSDLATKVYIPGGVMLSSPLFEPVDGIVTGNVAGGKAIKLFYTKIGNQVTISCRMFISTVGGTLGNVSSTFTGIAGEFGRFTDANLGPDIVAQMNNDILVRNRNAAGAPTVAQLRIPGIFSNETTGATVFIDLFANEIRICSTAVADSHLAAEVYVAGGVTFLAQNAAIVV